MKVYIRSLETEHAREKHVNFVLLIRFQSLNEIFARNISLLKRKFKLSVKVLILQTIRLIKTNT